MGLGQPPTVLARTFGTVNPETGLGSDLGTWCMYGELCAEITVLGFKVSPTEQQAARLYNDFHIEKLADALKRDTFFGDPGDEHSERQRAILRSAYLP
jgi:hypothetical protein